MAFWPQSYSSKQILKTKDGQNRDLVFQSGIAVFNERGTGSTWHYDDLWILTDVVWTRVSVVQASVSLASISNLGEAINAGWGTDAVSTALYNNRIMLQVRLAVRDSDGYMHRVSYQVTAMGTLA